MNDHITDNLTTDMAIAAALRTFLTSPAIISMIQACVTEAANAEVQRLISDDRIRNAIKDELEDCPRYFTRAVEDIVQGSIDIDDIADTVKDRVIDDLDLDTVVSDKLIEHFDDDDNLRFITRRVVDSFSITITPSR
jgi:hypothetical protein